MDDRRARLESRIQQLIDAGRSKDEIRGMRSQLLSELNDPNGGARQQMGPTPAGAPTEDAYPMPAPMNPLEAQQQSQGVFGTIKRMGQLAASAPGEAMANPGAVPRSLETGAVNVATMGKARDLHGPALARMRAKAEQGGLSPDDLQVISMWQDAANPGRQRTPITDPMAALDELGGVHQRTQAETSAQPGMQFLGGAAIAPATLPGRVAGVASGGIGAAGAPLVEGMTGLSGVAARTALNTARATGGGMAVSATEDAATGNFEGMGERALTGGGVAAALGAPAALLGEAGQGIRNAVKNSKGGQARRLIEESGGNVSPLTSGNQGPFAPGARLAGKKPNSKGIGEASRESAVSILNRNEADLGEGLKSPLAQKAALDAENKGHVVVNDLVEQMQQLQQGEVLSPGEQATVDGWLRRLDKYAVHADGTPTGVYAMPPKALNEFRTMLDGATGAGEAPGTVAKAKMQGVAAAARSLVGETDYGGVNKQIHGARNDYEGVRRLLRLGDSPSGGAMTPEGLPRADVERVTQMMARQSQNTTTSGGQNSSVDTESAVPGQARANLDQLAEQYPQHKADVRMPQVLDAKGDLGFRMLPRTDAGGLLERLRSAGPSVLAGLAAGGGGVAAGHPILAAAGGVAATGIVNSLPAIQGRLMYRPALMAGGAGDVASAAAPYAGALTGPLMNPLEALLEQQRLLEQQKRTRKAKR